MFRSGSPFRSRSPAYQRKRSLSRDDEDGHPSIYGKNVTDGRKVSTRRHDCSHWCVPGVPDAWNELIYNESRYVGDCDTNRIMMSILERTSLRGLEDYAFIEISFAETVLFGTSIKGNYSPDHISEREGVKQSGEGRKGLDHVPSQPPTSLRSPQREPRDQSDVRKKWSGEKFDEWIREVDADGRIRYEEFIQRMAAK
ncbi:hypothetical protein IFM89_004962 [Coptis chinensis]|uniref:Trichome birefringence-like C-terminal domain-containing protein n=1 Tax=Coptis chinensis TaxID=261450 RepID=A0A835LYL9_9MAGN|nr:hypothetical protein IFM89_004962 [Coptis chinensis]